MSYVPLIVQCLHEVSGQGGECERIGLRFRIVTSTWAELAVESVAVCVFVEVGSSSIRVC